MKGGKGPSPMLAAEGLVGGITYPKLASFKYNGVRGFVKDGILYARSLQPIPNAHCQQLFGRAALNGFDGELVVGPFGEEDVFTKSTSGVMTAEGFPDVRFYAFDVWDSESEDGRRVPFKIRIADLSRRHSEVMHPCVTLVKHAYVANDEQVIALEKVALAQGYEGLVLRDPEAPYKFGRSTELEGGFLRFVQWHKSECVILEILEGETNTNEKTTNELGYAKRSHHKAGKVKTGVAGKMRVQDLVTKVIFKIPIAGDDLKAWFWEHRLEVVGRVGTYKFRTSVKTAPRYPQWEGFRDQRDMS